MTRCKVRWGNWKVWCLFWQSFLRMKLVLARGMLNTTGEDGSGLSQLPGKLKPRFGPGYWCWVLLPRPDVLKRITLIQPKPGCPLFCSITEVQESIWEGECVSLPQLLLLLDWRFEDWQPRRQGLLSIGQAEHHRQDISLAPSTPDGSSSLACIGEKALFKPSSLLRLNDDCSEGTYQAEIWLGFRENLSC